jgi:hypothetical protein
VDQCGVCDNNNNNDNVTCTDECGQLYGDNSTCSDECGVPNGDNSSCSDCNGVPNGTAKIDPHYNEDSCTINECVGGNTGIDACVQDCAYKWGGSATFQLFYRDHDGDGLGIGTASSLCYEGFAIPGWATVSGDLDDDCTSNIIDDCLECDGICYDSDCTPNTSCADCHGTPFGDATLDNCGTCVGGYSPNVACTQDCDGAWGGFLENDDCGVCSGGADGHVANDNVTCTDLCDVIWGENDCLDECGVPDGDDSSCADCHDDPNGTPHSSRQSFSPQITSHKSVQVTLSLATWPSAPPEHTPQSSFSRKPPHAPSQSCVHATLGE